jgi:uncharacterized membrane protein
LVTVSVYFAVEYWTLRTWNSEESLVVELVDIGETSPRDPGEGLFRTMDVAMVVRVLSKEQQDKTFSIVATQMEEGGPQLKKGRHYILVADVFEDDTVQYSIADAFRIPLVVSFITFACTCLAAFAGRAGVMALLGLGLSLGCLLWLYVPLAAKGVSPVPLAFVAMFFITLATVFCVVRRKQARTVALLGTLGGIGGAFVIGYSMVELWQLSGLAGENASLLASTIPGMDMRGILLASVAISAVGAVLDVGISITAAMSELVEYDDAIALPRLWAAGVRVGSEVLGSMINTLILAYFGTSLPMAILISNAGANFRGLLNDPYIGEEIVHSLAGTSGLVLTIPMTATFFVIQEKLLRQKRRGKDELK